MKLEFLGDHILETSLRNKQDARIEVYSVTNTAGFLPSNEYFSKDVYSKNTKTYKIVRPGQFAYNPSRINVGSVDYLKAKHDVLVSPLYTVFACKETLDQEYLLRFLRSPIGNSRIRGKTQGAVRDTLPFKKLSEIRIPLPTIDEQRRIADLLSKAESLIAKRKESIALLDEYLKSVFLEMFGDPVRNEKGWEKKSGEQYFEKLTVGVVIKPASYYVEHGVIALRSLNIKPNRIDLTNLVYFSHEANNGPLAKSKLKSGDVVFVRTGSTGTAAIVPDELDGANCIDLIVTRPRKEMVDPLYLVFFFNSEFGKRLVASQEVGGIQKHFNIGAIRSLKIPIPQLDTQCRFAQLALKVDRIKEKLITSQLELESLYNVLIRMAFQDISKF
jgi:type I restriction enzyme, S subunit